MEATITTNPVRSWYRTWLFIATAAFVALAVSVLIAVTIDDSDPNVVVPTVDRGMQADSARLEGLAEHHRTSAAQDFGSADALAHRAETSQSTNQSTRPDYGSADALARRLAE